MLCLFLTPALRRSVSSLPSTSICAVTLVSCAHFSRGRKNSHSKHQVGSRLQTWEPDVLRCNVSPLKAPCVCRIQPKPYRCWWRAASAASTCTVRSSAHVSVEIKAESVRLVAETSPCPQVFSIRASSGCPGRRWRSTTSRTPLREVSQRPEGHMIHPGAVGTRLMFASFPLRKRPAD